MIKRQNYPFNRSLLRSMWFRKRVRIRRPRWALYCSYVLFFWQQAYNSKLRFPFSGVDRIRTQACAEQRDPSPWKWKRKYTHESDIIDFPAFFDIETTQEITTTPQALSLLLFFFNSPPSNSPFKMIFIHHQPKLFFVISMHSAVSRNRDLPSVELLLLHHCSVVEMWIHWQ